MQQLKVEYSYLGTESNYGNSSSAYLFIYLFVLCISSLYFRLRVVDRTFEFTKVQYMKTNRY